MKSDRNDPGRFFGDGVTFKAKLIGILEVGEARGDRMCQEALQDLKMAIRAAGEHKQRITIHVTIDGLRLRDEKTSDSLYHHPVHKISFIAQDMTDSRAFGYIFGSPDSGHRFFGIKTDKAASQVVLAMRDLFQVVFELKKKEIEMARQQIQSKIVLEHNIPSKVKSTGTDPMNALSNTNACEAEKSNPKEASPESVADLVDLEQELSSIQRGITQMERITPNEPSTTTKIVTSEDPFGDSFTIYQLLPPPESSRSRYLRANKSSEIILSETSNVSSNSQPTPNSVNTYEVASPSTAERFGSKFDKIEVTPAFAESHLSTISMTTASSTKTHTSEENSPPKANDELSPSFVNASTSSENFCKMSFIDAFSDLDPLGTGKSKPYIDKKYFFQDLKNPPKKVLKDLSQKDVFSTTFQKCESGQSDSFELCNESSIIISSLEKPNFSEDNASKISQTSDKSFKIELNASKVSDPIMVKRDTDPFSPTRKKSDPFQEGNIFPSLDSCELEFGDNEQPTFPDKSISSVEAELSKKDNVFNGPLQVNLPPENFSSITQKKTEKQASESPISSTRTRPSVFKQNTVDVISSISSKKMPQLFGQKFSKRDSNNINMRRLQESDSLSENESAPEPPPRPDSTSQVEPPPLPPKKQFTDIVIRPQITSSSTIQAPAKYDYVTTRIRYTTDPSSEIVPPIPPPSRKIVRTNSNFSGQGRSGKNLSEEDDYLTPIPNYQDVPPLLPPPQSKSRVRRHDNIEIKTHKEMLSSSIEPTASKKILPDITLSQLLTLGIDEIAVKLDVPTSKLNTMTLVELTACLSNFLENSGHVQEETSHNENSPLFRVNFENTFASKFEDYFEEEANSSFAANFENLSATAAQPKETTSNIEVPSEDRYAVFREILEQEKQSDISGAGDGLEKIISTGFDAAENLSDIMPIGQNTEESYKFPVAKIDTKITEVISHAKDRYAALRDIILVEDLFDIPKQPLEDLKKIHVADINDKSQDILKQTRNEHEPENTTLNRKETENSLEPVEKIKEDDNLITTVNVSNAEDLEINEYMHLTLSNLSLECQAKTTPVTNESITVDNVRDSHKSPLHEQNISPVDRLLQEPSSQFNDVPTSRPEKKSPILKPHVSKSPHLQSPFPQSPCDTNLIDSNKPPDSGSISDDICRSSPDVDRATESRAKHTTDVVSVNISPSAQADSWAIFGSDEAKNLSLIDDKNTKYMQNSITQALPESPCSSDAKDEWRSDNDYRKKWRKGQTSSSSRDLSPWDEEISEQKKHSSDRIDKHGYYMRHSRCMNSCDDDYEYDEEILKRRQRRIKTNVTRNKEKLDLESQNRYHTSNHHNWSPPEEDGRGLRTLYRNTYERGTYGPPLRDRKMSSYDNRYEKRKYYREYSDPEYVFDSYTDSADIKERNLPYYSDKGPRDYEDIYLEGLECNGRGYKSRDFSFDRDRKHFDRDSIGSYEGTSRERRVGREEGYGSLDSREEFRERYMGGCEKMNTLRKSVKIRSNQDVEHVRKNPCDLRNLPISNQKSRTRKSSGSSPWDCEDVVLGQPPCQRISKRPASASESERRLCESRRVLCHALSGSDGEKDRRVRRRSRIRGEEEQSQPEQSFEPFYHGSNKRNMYDFMDCVEFADPVGDEFARLNTRQNDMHHRLKRTDYPQRRKVFGNLSFYNEDDDMVPTKYETRLKKNSFFSKIESDNSPDIFEDQLPMPNDDKGERRRFDINIYVQTPQEIVDCNKFNYEEQGFESDFNSPPPLPAGVSSMPGKPIFRFSNDFTEKENKLIAGSDNFEQEEQLSAIAPKLRFDDNITVPNFNNERSATLSKFEDDFSTSEFVLEYDDRTSELRKCNNSSRLLPKQRQQDQIKKSESVNIFGRKSEDPFEDDDFFKSSPPALTTDEDENIENTHVANCDIKNKQSTNSLLKWDHNFAKFDENI